MALSSKNKKVKTKKRTGKKASPKTPDQRPQEEMKVAEANTETPPNHETTQPTNLFVRKALRAAFACKDKVVSSPSVQQTWNTATSTLVTVLDKNPKVSAKLNQLNSRYQVSEKINQAMMLAKLIEIELRQKL